MARRSLVLVSLLAACLATQTQAGIFKRTPKSNPTDQIAEQVKTLRADADERRRAAAAIDLAKVDAKAHPAALGALIEALLRDPSAGVRHEAAQSLGKIRPLSAQAGQALDHALASDSSQRVRMTAKTALAQYHVAGYRGAPQASANPAPAATPDKGASAPRNTATATRPPARPSKGRESAEPPVAAIAQPPRPLNSVTGIDIQPSAGAPPAARETKPAPAAKPAKPVAPKPSTKPDDEGPILIPPG